jgi:hypothetical protein
MENFFFPIVDFKVDAQRLLTEFDKFVKPEYDTTLCYCLTTKEEFINDLDYDFRKFYGKLTPPGPGIKLISGDYDYQIVHWPKILEGSYIQEVANLCSDVLGLSNPRVRCSVVNGKDEQHNIGFHTDQHAVSRIHIALKTTNECVWHFMKGDDIVKIHQPVDGIPMFVDTGRTPHDIWVPTGIRRIHIWFQYHNYVDEDRLAALQNKARHDNYSNEF